MQELVSTLQFSGFRLGLNLVASVVPPGPRGTDSRPPIVKMQQE